MSCKSHHCLEHWQLPEDLKLVGVTRKQHHGMHRMQELVDYLQRQVKVRFLGLQHPAGPLWLECQLLVPNLTGRLDLTI